jgi:hypothetical protein
VSARGILMSRVIVLGSLNMDLVVALPRPADLRRLFGIE